MYRIVVGNERDNPDLPRVQVVEDFRTIERLDGDIYMINEVREIEDHEDLRKVFPDSEWYHPFLNMNAILIRKRKFIIRNCTTRVFHPGEAGFTPKRYVNGVEYRRRHYPGLPWTAVTCGHLINRAWNGKEKDPAVEERRRELWRKGWRVWDDLADEYYRRNISHFFGGDFNRLAVPKFRENQQWINGEKDIIKIGAIQAPRRRRIRIHGEGHVGLGKLHTDHPYFYNDVSSTYR